MGNLSTDNMKLVLFAGVFASVSLANSLDEYILDRKEAESHLRVRRQWSLFGTTQSPDNNGGSSTATTAGDGATTPCSGWLCPVPTTAARVVSPEEADAEQTDRFIQQYGLHSVKKWDEWKDELEENPDIPEEEVDELESCTSKCKWKDRMLDLRGKAHEELVEAIKKGREAGKTDLKIRSRVNSVFDISQNTLTLRNQQAFSTTSKTPEKLTKPSKVLVSSKPSNKPQAHK